MEQSTTESSPKSAVVYLDNEDRTVYYLAFDLLLVRASVDKPIRDGVVLIEPGGGVVDTTSSDTRADAYHAVIRSELIRKWLVEGVGPSWQPEVDRERARAEKLALQAGLSEPPGLDGGRIATVILKSDPN